MRHPGTHQVQARLVWRSSVSHVIPRVGAVASTFLIVTGQLAANIIIDHYGLFDATVHQPDISRLAGIAVMLVGV